MKWFKFAVLVAFVITSALAVHHFNLFDYSRADVVAKLESMGPWSRVAFVVAYALLVCLTVPGTAVTVFGATFFGLGETYLMVLVGATIGASLSFGLGRLLGREAVESVLSKGGMFERIEAISHRFEARGVLAVAYLRMAYVPFVVLNYLAPLTGIRFRDFVVGTVIGILPGTFVFVFLGNTLQSAWDTGDWGRLVSVQGAIAVALFVASLGLPWLANRVFRPVKPQSTGDGDPFDGKQR
ncbi:MAG: VTT domain-containing protein [bacterium]